MVTAIRNWVVQTMMKGQTGVVRTLPKPQIIELNTQITAEQMMRNGINPNDMKTVGQVENVVKQIDTPKVNVNPGVTGVKKADVLDMEGNKIPEGSGIMGGKAVPGTSDREKVRNEMKKKYGFTDERLDEIENTQFDEKIGDDLLREDDERIIKERLEKQNKDSVQRFKNKMDDPEEFADGGRIGLLAGSVPKVLKLLKNKKRVQQAVDDIFPTGDYKYDAQMAADALVENNPKTFGGKLYEDLDMDTQMEVYGAVLQPITNNMAKQMQLKRATRPEKTLQSMKEGKGIDMSDPEIADEFTTFMKERDPEGYKKLEQTVELSNFKTKGRKENSDGGRIGLEGGTNEDFQNYLKERERFEKERSLEQLFKEYKEDLRRKGVMEQKQMAADGGRIGLKAGMTKRGFLKLMGSVGAGIGAAKSGIFSGFGKGAGKTVAKEVAQQTTSSTPPAYFFKLAEKIKNSGDDVTKRFATKDREVVTNYQSKNGDFEMYEDLDTGDVRIKIIKGDPDAPGYNQQELTLTKGQADETTKGTPADEYDEYTVKSDFDGKMKDVEDGLDDIEDIIDEIGVENITVKDLENAGYIPERLPYEVRKKLGIKDAPSIKYASGGLAYMLGE